MQLGICLLYFADVKRILVKNIFYKYIIHELYSSGLIYFKVNMFFFVKLSNNVEHLDIVFFLWLMK